MLTVSPAQFGYTGHNGEYNAGEAIADLKRQQAVGGRNLQDWPAEPTLWQTSANDATPNVQTLHVRPWGTLDGAFATHVGA